jgi:hypothetical protein
MWAKGARELRLAFGARHYFQGCENAHATGIHPALTSGGKSVIATAIVTRSPADT